MGGGTVAQSRETPKLGVRSTRQRAAIVELMNATDTFISAQDVHAELREAGHRIGLTTVYRTLQSLAEAHAVDVVRNDAGEQLYRRCSDTHHHHLMCRECGYTVEIEARQVEEWTQQVATQNGFTEVSHTIELVGLCRDCAA